MGTPPRPIKPLTPAEITEFADIAIPRLRRVPRFSGSVHVCRLCHGAADPVGVEYCKTCIAWWGLDPVQDPPLKVTPISLYKEFEEFDDWYGQYWGYPAKPETEQRARIVFAAAIGEFLRNHTSCLLGDHKGPKPNLVTVPSAEHRSGTHPLRAVLRALPPERAWVEADVLRATPALPDKTPPHPRAPAGRRWFAPTGPIRGLKVLVVDDIWETGAHLSAAVEALRAAGARVLGAVVVGRSVDPSATVQADRVWKWAQDRRFSYERCCWCSPDPERPFQRSAQPRIPPDDA